MRIHTSWWVVLAVIVAVLTVPSLRRMRHVVVHSRTYYFPTNDTDGGRDAAE